MRGTSLAPPPCFSPPASFARAWRRPRERPTFVTAAWSEWPASEKASFPRYRLANDPYQTRARLHRRSQPGAEMAAADAVARPSGRRLVRRLHLGRPRPAPGGARHRLRRDQRRQRRRRQRGGDGGRNGRWRAGGGAGAPHAILGADQPRRAALADRSGLRTRASFDVALPVQSAELQPAARGARWRRSISSGCATARRSNSCSRRPASAMAG